MNYRNLCRRLIAELRRVREETAEILADIDDIYSRQAAACRRRAQEAEADYERERQEREYREYQREQALHALDRARAWGDEWAEDRAIRELRTF